MSMATHTLPPPLREGDRLTSDEFFWKKLAADGYRPLESDSDGITRSDRFPGLWLDVQALWDRDLLRKLAVLQQGLAPPEHAAFVLKLAEASPLK